MRLSVVIPAHNEAGNIGRTLDLLHDALVEAGIDHEIIVIDDGSTDDTANEVGQRIRVHPEVKLESNTGKHGFGCAVRVGLDRFSGDAVVIMMADGSDDARDVVKYYEVLRHRADCAFGSRWIRGARVSDYPPFKRVINRIANRIVQLMFGLRYNDVTNAFKGYRRYVVDGCRPLLSPHFNLTVELPLKAIVRGYSYEVVPISWRNRDIGQSSLRLQEMGSRYLDIVLNVWLERLLTKGDYRRSPEDSLPAPVGGDSGGRGNNALAGENARGTDGLN